MSASSDPRESMSDHTIRRHMPSPMAVAWQRVHLETGSAGRIRRTTATLDVLLRLLAVVSVADYLRGPPDEKVDKLLARLEKPTLGMWLGLAREASRAVAARDDDPFVPEMVATWFDSKLRLRAPLKRLDALVALRNDAQHGVGVGGGGADAEVSARLVDGLREVLGDLSWLTRYQLFRVVDQQPTRSRSTRGRVQILSGSAEREPVAAEWTARLFSDAVYLASPSADRVLELSPLIVVDNEPQVGLERPYLLHAVHRSGDLVWACDETGHTRRAKVDQGEGRLSFAEWLASRSERDPCQDNEDRAGTLGSLLGGSADASGSLLDGRFALHEQLGEGGMGVVYRATDRVTGADTAVKVLREELALDPEVRARFKREGTTMASMRHASVLSGTSIGQTDDGQLYMSMPLLDGGTVAQRIRAGDVSDEERERWAQQLLAALAHLAAKGVVHRDVKPSNLLLDREGNAVLADFGIAIGASDARLTRTLSQLGSLAYLPPEGRTGALDMPADAWAAAVVLHELWTGELPRTTPGEGLDGRIGEVVRALGQLDPDERASAADALAALEDRDVVLGTTPVTGSNDEIVLWTAAAGGVVTAALLALPVLTGASWGWVGWVAAAGVWAASGRWMADRAYGPPMPFAALSGLYAGMFAFGFGGLASLLHQRAIDPAPIPFGQFASAAADASTGTLVMAVVGFFGTGVAAAAAAAAGAFGREGRGGTSRPAWRLRGDVGVGVISQVVIIGTLLGLVGEIIEDELTDGSVFGTDTLVFVMTWVPVVGMLVLGLPGTWLQVHSVEQAMRHEPGWARWLLVGSIVFVAGVFGGVVAVLPAEGPWRVACLVLCASWMLSALVGGWRGWSHPQGDAQPRTFGESLATAGGMLLGAAPMGAAVVVAVHSVLVLAARATVMGGYAPLADDPLLGIAQTALMGGLVVAGGALAWAGLGVVTSPFTPPRGPLRTRAATFVLGVTLLAAPVLGVPVTSVQVTATTDGEFQMSFRDVSEVSQPELAPNACFNPLDADVDAATCGLLGRGDHRFATAWSPIDPEELAGHLAALGVPDAPLDPAALPSGESPEVVRAWLLHRFAPLFPNAQPSEAVAALLAERAPQGATGRLPNPDPDADVSVELARLDHELLAGTPGASERIRELAAAHPYRFDVQTSAWVDEIRRGADEQAVQRLAMARDLRMRPIDVMRVMTAYAERGDRRLMRAVATEYGPVSRRAYEVYAHGLELAMVVPEVADPGWAADLIASLPERCDDDEASDSDDDREKCARGDRLAAQAERFVASAEAAPRALPELWSALSEPSTAAWRWVPCPIELRHALDADDDQALQRFVDVVSPRCSAARGRQLLVSIARDQLQRRAADPGAPADPAPSN